MYSIIKLSIDENGNRPPHLEKNIDSTFEVNHKHLINRINLSKLELTLERELHHRNVVKPDQSYTAKRACTLLCVSYLRQKDPIKDFCSI